MNCTAKILNSYNVGKVIEEGNNTKGVGGVVGWVSATGTSGEISHNYSIGKIEINGTNVTDVGGAIGHYQTTTFEINHNYYEQGKANVTLNTLGEALSGSNMKLQSFVNMLNEGLESALWEIVSGQNNGYPVLKK